MSRAIACVVLLASCALNSEPCGSAAPCAKQTDCGQREFCYVTVFDGGGRASAGACSDCDVIVADDSCAYIWDENGQVLPLSCP